MQSYECDQIFFRGSGTGHPESRALDLLVAEPGPLSVGQTADWVRYIRTQGASTLEPGIRGALEVHVHTKVASVWTTMDAVPMSRGFQGAR